MTNSNSYNEWLNKEQIIETIISAETANLMNAALDRAPAFRVGDPLPPAWHWLYFHEPVPNGHLGIEGHAMLGGFMPSISFGEDSGKDSGKDIVPRRMWAGGALTFERPIRLGDRATKRSAIRSITPKEGRSGKLCFVIVEHMIFVGHNLCLREEQTIVYREPAASGATEAIPAKPAPTDADFSMTYTPDPVLLFRYSALTFNAHRIHYDVDFCRQQEGYPNLVVHGPLTATLLLDLYYQRFPNRQLTSFEYRGVSPLFNPNPFTVNGKETGEAWVANAEGGLVMQASCVMGGEFFSLCRPAATS